MKIAVLGMGKTGHSTSCYLMDRNQSVTCWDRDAAKLDVIREGITCTGVLEGFFAPEVESDLAKAIDGADYIFINTVAGGHKPVAELLSGHLSNNQRILVCNSNWGVMEFLQVLGKEIREKGVVLCETGGFHIMTDLPDVGHCHIKKIKSKLSISCFPRSQTEEVLKELNPIFPQFVPAESPIMTSMDTSNPMLHAPIALCGFSKIEGGVDHFFYKEGGTPSGVKYIEKIDNERLAVMEAMGVKGTSCLDIVNKAWKSSCTDLYSAIHANYPTSKGPKSIEYRFITEDIPYGVAPVVKLGRAFGVPTPYSELLVNMYSALMDRDFMALGPIFRKDEIAALIRG
ncbi:MAG: NAD/NADP octopine/nopaline dehydrogenase family protein [Spirochaetales bacterium]|nr:NAD/NADP octopine/nopaline dehydrogenase family protein [Spirochaetales bacterium]